MSSFQFYERYWKDGKGIAENKKAFFILSKKKLKRALSFLPKGTCVLDAGCGRGDYSGFIRGLGYKVEGFDISPTAINAAREFIAGIRFEIGSLEDKLPFGADKFAAVWCSEVLEHLLDVHGALAEINRVLMKDGLLVLTVPYHGLFKNLAIALYDFEGHYNPYISHIRFYTKRSLKECLSRAGFSVIRWEGLGRCWPIWMSIFVIARKTSFPESRPEIRG